MKANPILKLIGTSLYTGYIPIGPGTIGSILAIPLIILLPKNTSIYFLVTIAVSIIGVIAAYHLGKVWQKKDDQRITIDEFAGMMLTLLFIKTTWWILIIGFILFRFCDIVKPLFIRSVERAPGGFGVMLDDIVSGIFANLCLRLILLIVH
jgi:phosphatidylglycerophosphatase A